MYADPRISHHASTKECTHSEYWYETSQLAYVGPKSWFTEYMGIQESASTLVPKNSLIRNLVMRPRSWLDVGPKSWFTECMGIQESASTLVPKDSLIRNLKVSRSRNKIVMQKLLPRNEQRICFSILKSSYMSKTCTAERSSNSNLSKHKHI